MGFRSQLAALGACSLLLLLVNAWQRGSAQPVTMSSRRRVAHRQSLQPVAALLEGQPPAAPASPYAAAASVPAGTSPLEETCEGIEHLELVCLPRSGIRP